LSKKIGIFDSLKKETVRFNEFLKEDAGLADKETP
jgi:hypothetical protein